MRHSLRLFSVLLNTVLLGGVVVILLLSVDPAFTQRAVDWYQRLTEYSPDSASRGANDTTEEQRETPVATALTRQAESDVQSLSHTPEFYERSVTTPSGGGSQRYLYGTLVDWDFEQGKLRVESGGTRLTLQADASGVYLSPRSDGVVITQEQVSFFLQKPVTLWVSLRDGVTFVEQLAVTKYD